MEKIYKIELTVYVTAESESDAFQIASSGCIDFNYENSTINEVSTLIGRASRDLRISG